MGNHGRHWGKYLKNMEYALVRLGQRAGYSKERTQLRTEIFRQYWRIKYADLRQRWRKQQQ